MTHSITDTAAHFLKIQVEIFESLPLNNGLKFSLLQASKKLPENLKRDTKYCFNVPVITPEN